jgi:transcription-repair coupling factor (superfamily II helicase)
VPAQVNELFDGLRLRTLAKKLGFERLVLKNRKMNGYFVSNPQSMYYETRTFQEIMRYVSTQGPVAGISMKQSGKFLILTRENIKTLKQAKAVLESMLEFVSKPADQ